MGVSYGEYDCLDPVLTRDQCAAKNLPAPWYGRPNSYECPAGTEPGIGWLLLPQFALNNLDFSTAYPLTFTTQETANKITSEVIAKAILIVNAECINPGLREDPAAPFLVKIADRRWVYAMVPINKAYNVVQPNADGTTGGYYSATLNSGKPWTWQQMVSDIWLTVIPTAYGLPPDLTGYTPAGYPENFSFYASYAMQALQEVLDAMGLELIYDPVADLFSVAQIGATSLMATRALTAADPVRVWDGQPQDSVLASYPATVRVTFLADAPALDGGTPYYFVEETDPEGTLEGVYAGSTVWLFDSLSARVDASDTLQNLTQLQARAAQRAADYYRQIRQQRMRRVYGRALGNAGLRPGAQISSIRWGDRGRGLVTEINRSRPPVPALPLAPSGAAPLAWIKATSATPTTIYLGRTITDGVISGGTTLTSASANFTSDDNGATVIGTGIPASTTITVVNNTTVTLSNASVNGSSLTVEIVTGTTTGCTAKIDSWNSKTGAWPDGTTVWLLGVNSESFALNRRYQCRYLGTDDQNVQIWATSLAIPYDTSTVSSVTLSSTWSNTGLSVTLPANTTWRLETQLTASLTSSATGAFDYLTARYYDGTNTYGVAADFCYSVCDSITVLGTACLKTIIAVGNSSLTINVQAEIVTSTASTATLSGGELDAVQLQ